jgi:hypothetical protein
MQVRYPRLTLVAFAAIVFSVACSKDKNKNPVAPPATPANVVLTNTQTFNSNSYYTVYFYFKNVGGSTAYSVWLQTSVGTHFASVCCNTPSHDLAPAQSGQVTAQQRYQAPVLYGIHWSNVKP